MVFTQFPRLQGQSCLLDYMIKIRLPIFVTRAEQKLHKVEEMYHSPLPSQPCMDRDPNTP